MAAQNNYDVRTTEFRDYNNNGIDDRDETSGTNVNGGAAPPPQNNYDPNNGVDPNVNPYTTPPPLQDGMTGEAPYNPYGQNGYGGSGMRSGRSGGVNPTARNSYGGQTIAGGMPAPADYQSVQQYADAAYDNSMRYINPQQNQQNRRQSQDMINRGIDPNSAMGMDQKNQLNMAQNDQNNAAAYSSMQFGQGIQNQMFQQEFANQDLAGQMQRGLWDAQANRYNTDSSYSLGMGNLNMNQQQNEFNQMMGLENVDFRNRGYNDGLMQYQDQLTLAMLGMNPVPVGGMTNPYNPYGSQAGNGGTSYGVNWRY